MNPQIRRAILDLGPLLLFFAGFKFWGIYGAVAIFSQGPSGDQNPRLSERGQKTIGAPAPWASR